MEHPVQPAAGTPAVSRVVVPLDPDLALLLEAEDAVSAARKQRHDDAALLRSLADPFEGTATFVKEHARALDVEEFVTRLVREHWVPAITLARKAPPCRSLHDLRWNTTPEFFVARAFGTLLGPKSAREDVLAEEAIAGVIGDLASVLRALATRGFDLATLGELFASLAQSLRQSAATHQEQFERNLPLRLRRHAEWPRTHAHGTQLAGTSNKGKQRKKGRPRVYDRAVDQRIVSRWKQAHKVDPRLTVEEHARAEGTTKGYLKNAIERVRK